MYTDEYEVFSKKVHNFLNRIRTENISIEDKKKLYFLVNNLPVRTENQKKRLLLYYGIILDNKPLTLAEIAHMDNCSLSAVQCSIIKVRSNMARLNGESKELLEKIILKNKEGVYEYDVI